MNLRILKKLSKRAAPLLVALGDTRQQFKAEKWDNYIGTAIWARKHWERSRTVWKDIPERKRDEEICYRSRAGHVIVMRIPSHPLKGTPMIGATSGYYEPEWDEETAWCALRGLVCAHFTQWDAEGGPKPTRRLVTPSDVFEAARDMINDGGSHG